MDERARRLLTYEERRLATAARVATGTLACPRCDAPVAPGAEALTPAQPFGCPYCLHRAPVRDFLSLTAPSRPARVAVRVAAPAPRPLLHTRRTA